VIEAMKPARDHSVLAAARELPPATTIARRVAARFFTDRGPMMAAAMSYQVLFSIIPVTALLVAGIGWWVQLPDVRAEVIRRITERIPLDRNLVIDAIRGLGETNPPLTWIGAALLVWTSIGLFSSVRDTLNVVWRTRGPNVVHRTLIDLAAIVTLALLLVTSIVSTAALHTVFSVSRTALGGFSGDLDRLWSLITQLYPPFATFAAFVLLYRFVPNVRHSLRDVVPGATLATILFEVGKNAFTLYVARYSRYELLYGTLGAVMLFQLWVYVSTVILLIGAEVNAVLFEARRPAPEAPGI
jgi:membrane protein